MRRPRMRRAHALNAMDLCTQKARPAAIEFHADGVATSTRIPQRILTIRPPTVCGQWNTTVRNANLPTKGDSSNVPMRTIWTDTSKPGHSFCIRRGYQSLMTRYPEETRQTACIDGDTGAIGRCSPSVSCWDSVCYCAGSAGSATLPCDTPCLPFFSDFLRYQNMLCRYDTDALKCQDIFSVHGFPVGLIQCENNLLGIPKIGAGSFRHFVEKYIRAKRYCEAPFETRMDGKRKQVVPIPGERIGAEIVRHFPIEDERQAQIAALPAAAMPLSPGSLDGVFTDPPYFANVQYAELIDFNYVWLRQALRGEFPEFASATTRSSDELTGNVTLGRGIEHFTEGLSAVFCRYAAALKAGAPFVFTYHHNDPAAYVAVVVAILDAELDCTATLPAAAEMGASLHIHGTKSSVLDSVFVCRPANGGHQDTAQANIRKTLAQDAAMMAAAGVKVSQGDIRCLASGHIARAAVNKLRGKWDSSAMLSDRMRLAEQSLVALAYELNLDSLPRQALEDLAQDSAQDSEE